jgi:hypothetical protein
MEATERIYGLGCDRVVGLIEQKILYFKTTLNQSPSFLIVSKDNYQCLLYQAHLENPNSNSFPEVWQGIPIVIIPGHEILELAGSARDMYLYQLKYMEKFPKRL